MYFSSLASKIRAYHHFTLAYIPWSNGMAEVLNREILLVFRALLSEFWLSFLDWPRMLPLVQSGLNHISLKRFNGVSFLIALTILPSKSPLQSHIALFAPRSTPFYEIVALSQARLSSLHSSLMYMQSTLVAFSKYARDKICLSRNRASKLVTFALGDLVLVASHVRAKSSSKLMAKWMGPKRITAILRSFI
jgi:hypothetical protein